MRGLNDNSLSNRLEEMANQINLKEMWNRPIETLSKGFKRRVGIAQALIHDPDILILDEPTDGLDPNQKHEMRNLIKRISTNKAIVISTHILEEVEAVCSRAVIIANGKLLANDTPKNLENKFNEEHFNTPSITQASTSAWVTIQNAPHLNFNDEDFCISFYYKPNVNFNTFTTAETTEFILTKEGAQDSPPLGSEAGGDFSTDITGALDITTIPAPSQFPYKLSVKGINGGGTGSLTFERFDGENRSFVSGNIFHTSDNGLPIHVIAQRKDGILEIYKNGVIAVDGDGNGAQATENTGICQNKSNITLFKKQNPNGTYNISLETNRKFRDTSAWYHIVVAFDSNLSQSNRVKIYVNGIQVTSFSTSIELSTTS